MKQQNTEFYFSNTMKRFIYVCQMCSSNKSETIHIYTVSVILFHHFLSFVHISALLAQKQVHKIHQEIRLL